ncbi:hypothetical protein SCALM49S_00051 [Streptomyces californicus]
MDWSTLLWGTGVPHSNTHRRPPVRRARPGAPPRGTADRTLTSVGAGPDCDRNPRPADTVRRDPVTTARKEPPQSEALAHHPQRLGRRGSARGGQTRPGTARARPSVPADQPLRQRPRGDPLLGRGPRSARRGRRRAAAVGRAPLHSPAPALGDRRPGGHRPRDLPPAGGRRIRTTARVPRGRAPVLTVRSTGVRRVRTGRTRGSAGGGSAYARRIRVRRAGPVCSFACRRPSRGSAHPWGRRRSAEGRPCPARSSRITGYATDARSARITLRA